MTRSVSYGPSITFSFGSNILHDVTDPASLQDAATKNYVDTHTSSGGVTSIQKTGSASITGSVTFSQGTNITITQSGHDLSIASTASGGGQAGVPSLTLSTANSIGTSASFVASNATVALFDTTNPASLAFSGAAAVGTAAFAARRDHVHAMPASPTGGPGSSSLVYRYTVTGSDKASIDTGVDTPDAGSNDWTNGDMLEVFMLLRSDRATVNDFVDITVNNDTSSVYEDEHINATTTTVSSAAAAARASWQPSMFGSLAASNVFAVLSLQMPFYASSAFKQGMLDNPRIDTSAGNKNLTQFAVLYAATSAINRFKVAASGTNKLKVNSVLLIYKWLAS